MKISEIGLLVQELVSLLNRSVKFEVSIWGWNHNGVVAYFYQVYSDKLFNEDFTDPKKAIEFLKSEIRKAKEAK